MAVIHPAAAQFSETPWPSLIPVRIPTVVPLAEQGLPYHVWILGLPDLILKKRRDVDPGLTVGVAYGFGEVSSKTHSGGRLLARVLWGYKVSGHADNIYIYLDLHYTEMLNVYKVIN